MGNMTYNKIYQNSSVVKNTIGPYSWINESLDNYFWTNKLGCHRR